MSNYLRGATIFILVSFIINKEVYAQSSKILCATDQVHKALLSNNPDYKTSYERTQEYFKQMDISNYKTVMTGSGAEYHVPVVVHVLHTGDAIGTIYNPTDAAIIAFMDQINQGFANTLDDASVPGTFNSVNIPIRFYLAQRNELASCAATTGINRINYASNPTYLANGVGSPGIADQTLKSVIHWNDLEYYNIYIVNKIDGVDGNCAPCTYTAGYANYPVLGGNPTDGMVVLSYHVTQPTSLFIHELGHAFNLRHPFEGGDATSCPPNTNCATDNDGVCDTDPVRLDFSCNPSGNNPCTGAWAASTTQFNYMTYFFCSDRFSPGQSTRINNTLNLIRTSYKNTGGLDPPPSSLPVNIMTPSYFSGNVGNTFDLGPTYVGLNSIDFNSGGYSTEGAGFVHYVDHTCNQTTTLIQTNSYPIEVGTSMNPHMVRVFIDFNNDGSFGTTIPELVLSSNVPAGNFIHSGMVSIPSSNVVYNTPLRMRVIADNNSGPITGTSQINYGQAEDYTIIIQPTPLPVMWRNFSATLVNDHSVDLRWSTEMEKDNDYFEVEKSSDGTTFFSIDKLEGAKEKYTPTYYSSLDKHPFSGINYYRIKQVDINKQVTYSKVETVITSLPSFQFTAYPNPTNDMLNITFNNQNQTAISIYLTDLNGKRIYYEYHEFAQGKFHTRIPTSPLNAGIYILNIVSEYDSKTLKIVKQ